MPSPLAASRRRRYFSCWRAREGRWAASPNDLGVATLADLRQSYHAALIRSLWGVRRHPSTTDAWHVEVEGHDYAVFNNADAHNPVSVVLSAGVASKVGVPAALRSQRGSGSGSRFERCTSTFVSDALDLFSHLAARRLVTTPPATHFGPRRPLPNRVIGNYAQFEHLTAIEHSIEGNAQLQAALGGDYLVKPDILVLFEPLTDADLNQHGAGLGASNVAGLTPLRQAVSSKPLLHASISCKWTMRRDRAQNTRLEALNLVRNRKGRLPHIAAVTMECDPDILGSLSLGTGDIDCVYHGALSELLDAADDADDAYGGVWTAIKDRLTRMVAGSRLRDIADLPLDLLT